MQTVFFTYAPRRDVDRSLELSAAEQTFPESFEKINDAPPEAGVAQFFQTVVSVRDFLAGQVVAGNVFLQLAFQLAEFLFAVEHDGVDDVPAEFDGRIQASFSGPQFVVPVDDNWGKLTEFSHAFHKRIKFPEILTHPFFYIDGIYSDTHAITSLCMDVHYG